MAEDIKNPNPSPEDLRRVQLADSLGAEAIAGAGEEDIAKIAADEAGDTQVDTTMSKARTAEDTCPQDEMPDPRKLDETSPEPRRLEAEPLTQDMTHETLRNPEQ